MKTCRLAAIAMCALLAAAGCNKNSRAAQTREDTEHGFALARSADVKRATPAADPALLREQAASNNRFAVAMYRELVEDGRNLFFSPHSMAAALGMAEAGARNETARQIREALQVTLEGTAYHDALSGLEMSLEGHVEQTDDLQLSIVNSIWAQTGFDFLSVYLDLLARSYGAGVNLLDFASAPDASGAVINDWMSDQTHGRIENLFPPGSISPDTRLVLTNAVYFLASWRYSFDQSLTTDEDFHRLDDSTVSVPLMQLGRGEIELEYAEEWYDTVPQVRARALNLYYQGERLCMTVLLPEPGAYASYENALTVDTVNELLSRLHKTDLPPVRLPRFTYTSSSLSLGEPLQSLGMHDAFVPQRADFSGIDGKGNLFVSQVLHKAFVAVDEKGTEAAAATAVGFGLESMPDVPPPRFVADRPFIFLIRDSETGLILFIGRILDPTQAE